MLDAFESSRHSLQQRRWSDAQGLIKTSRLRLTLPFHKRFHHRVLAHTATQSLQKA